MAKRQTIIFTDQGASDLEIVKGALQEQMPAKAIEVTDNAAVNHALALAASQMLGLKKPAKARRGPR